LLYSALLSPCELSQQAQILQPLIPLKGVFKDEIAEINNRKRQEEKAVKEIKKKRANKKEIRREEIIYDKTEQPNKETIHESVNLPVCTRTPRMLITGKNRIYQNLTLCTNNSKYLHQQRFKII